MSVVILQTFTAAEGRYHDLVDHVAELLAETASRPGVEYVHAAGDPESGVVTIYQQWGGPQSQADYKAWRAQNTDVAKLAGLLGGAANQQLAHIF